MTTSKRTILVTSALIYANGPVHLGHMLEQIQTDIWVRFQRMRGHDCIFIGGDDAHGTPIMIHAQKRGMTEEALIQEAYTQHQADFSDFQISFDNYHTTHSPENQELVNLFYERLLAKGDLKVREIEQAYDPVEQMFLPDRYVRGECPKCGAKDQYGDSCEVCGATYLPQDLKNPKSVISGVQPIQKKSNHYFFELKNYQKFLEQWLDQGQLQTPILHKLKEWFEEGLQSWDISRDAPYFGFEIPNSPNQYFYVWLDAPIGYMASFKNLGQKRKDLDFSRFWGKESPVELYHFIGKDIIYFHALFWTAMLEGSGFRKPSNIFCHGFLTVNGHKMSKSRGTFLNARDYLNHLDPEYLRYYFAAKLGDGIEDIDLNFEDFLTRVNADLVGKIVNIASRTASFIHKQFKDRLASHLSDPDLLAHFVAEGEKIAHAFEHRQYSHAIRNIMSLADSANRYIDEMKPWVLAKQPDKQEETHLVCTLSLNLFKVLMTYLKPVLPMTAQKVEHFLNIPEMTWENRKNVMLDHTIRPFEPLMQRIQREQMEALF